MRRHITQSLVVKLPAVSQIIRDNRLAGFAVRVSDKGKASFIVEGRIRRGGTVRLTIGKHPSTTVAEARTIARDQLALMDQGVDPRRHRDQQAEEADRQAAHATMMRVTLGDMLGRYLAARNLKPSTEKDYRWAFGYVFSDWLSEPVRRITRGLVEDRYTKIEHANGKPTAVKAMRYLSAVLNFSMAEEVDSERLITENPTSVLTQKRYDRSVKPRQRYLSDREIDQLLHYAYVRRSWPTREYVEKHGVSRKLKDGTWKPAHDGVTDQGLNYVLLLLHTGLRKSEMLLLRWGDIDWDKRFFIVRDTKNHSDHVVPFSDAVESLLKAQAAIADRSPWVFPSQASSSGHMTEPKSQLGRICKVTGLSFSLHDLRRTFATHARIHGSDFDLVKRALNHKSGDITDRYIQGTLELIRPVFEKVARGYAIYYDAEAVLEAEHPELFDPDANYDPSGDDVTDSLMSASRKPS